MGMAFRQSMRLHRLIRDITIMVRDRPRTKTEALIDLANVRNAIDAWVEESDGGSVPPARADH